MDMTLNVGHLITIVLFIIGGWIAVRNSTDAKFHEMSVSLARMEEKFDALAKNVEKHNHVSERMGVMEEHQKTMWIRQDELRDRMDKIECKD